MANEEKKQRRRSAATKQARCWTITSFDVEEPLEHNFDPQHHRFLVYQLERAPETKRPHYQGYVQYHTRATMRLVKTDFGNGIHCEPAKGSAQDNYLYCTKEPRLDGPWVHGVMVEERQRTDFEYYPDVIRAARTWNELFNSPDAGLHQFIARYGKYCREVFNSRPKQYQDPLADMKLFPWQERVMAKIRGPRPRRQLIWVWSQRSGTGKSSFLLHLSALHPSALVVRAFDRPADVYFQIQDDTKLILFDMPRFIEEKQMSSLIQVLEACSDGFCTSTKYEACCKRFDAWTVVFSNQAPPFVQLPRRICEVKAIIPAAVVDVPDVEERDDAVEPIDVVQ